MFTIHIKKDSDFETHPELEVPRQEFNALETLIANHRDTTHAGHQSGSFLTANAALLKRANLNAQKFEECQNEQEGNEILETKVSINPNILIMYINLSEIGIMDGRGSYEIKPDDNGFWLRALEVECYKNSDDEEAHAVKRSILRNYTVIGNYDWRNLTSTLMPDGTLYVAVNAICHPAQVSFPGLGQTKMYSSLSGKRPDFPASDQKFTFGSFTNCPLTSKCQKCGLTKSVKVQTDRSTGTQTCESNTLDTQTSLFSCTCHDDSMDSC